MNIKLKSTSIKRIFILIISTLTFFKEANTQSLQTTSNSFNVHGNIVGINNGMMMLGFQSGNDIVLDSSAIKDGNFNFKGSVQQPVSAFMYVKNVKYNWNQTLRFYLENSTITISANKDSIESAKVAGSLSNNDKDSIDVLLAPYYESFRSLRKVYDFAKVQHLSPVLDNLDKIYDELPHALRSILVEYALAHPGNYAITDMLEVNFTNDQSDLPLLKKIFNNFSSSVKQSQGGKNIAELIKRIERVQIGKEAPDFTLPDQNRNPVKLSTFHCKYILLDFWASWCIPCREENPNLVEAFKKYKARNFTIISISLDDKKDEQKWLDAIKKDNLSWTNLSSLKGYELGGIRVLYSVQGIPDNFLIDPKGKIIARGLRGDDLEKTLSEIIK